MVALFVPRAHQSRQEERAADNAAEHVPKLSELSSEIVLSVTQFFNKPPNEISSIPRWLACVTMLGFMVCFCPPVSQPPV